MEFEVSRASTLPRRFMLVNDIAQNQSLMKLGNESLLRINQGGSHPSTERGLFFLPQVSEKYIKRSRYYSDRLHKDA